VSLVKSEIRKSDFVFAQTLSGVRPSSGAETLEKDAACEMSDILERAEVAAAEDGRTPVNRYRRVATVEVRWLARFRASLRDALFSGPIALPRPTSISRGFESVLRKRKFSWIYPKRVTVYSQRDSGVFTYWRRNLDISRFNSKGSVICAERGRVPSALN